MGHIDRSRHILARGVKKLPDGEKQVWLPTNILAVDPWGHVVQCWQCGHQEKWMSLPVIGKDIA